MPKGNSYIRERRRALGLTQVELSVRADVSVRMIQFAEKGDKVITRKSLELIAMALGVEYSEILQRNESSNRDALFEWPWSLAKFVREKVLPEQKAFCRLADEAVSGIKLMRDSWQIHLNSSDFEGSSAIFTTADELLDEKYQAYKARYISLWHKNNSVLQFATLNGERTGISVVLPVSGYAYESLKCGQITFMDIAANDIEQSSQSLVLDSAVEFPNTGARPWYKITDSLSLAVFYQIAALSMNPAASDFRMLSFGASATNIKRLESIGFRSRGVVMPDFGYQICEFTNSGSDLDFDAYAANSTLTHFTRLFKAVIPSDFGLKAKRRMLVQLLRIYQKLLHRLASTPNKSLPAA